MKTEDTNVKVLDRAFDILECFTENEAELSLVEISDKTNLSPSTASRIIKSLENRKYLLRNQNTKKYSLGSKITQLGKISKGNSIEYLKNIAYPYMLDLRSKIDESISIYIRNGDNRICITRVESTQGLRQVIQVGDLYSLKQGATGKVLMAFASEEDQRRWLGNEDEAKMTELLEIKQNGFAVSSGEREQGVSAIAAPIFAANGTVIASLSLSGPSMRIVDAQIQEKVDLVKLFAKKISNALGYE